MSFSVFPFIQKILKIQFSREIFSYLDKVDSNCDKVLISSKNIAPDSEHHELEFALEPDVIEDVPK